MTETSKQQYSIYALVDPRDNSTRYIGMSIDPYSRLAYHILDQRKGPKTEWIADLKKLGLFPQFAVLEQCIDSSDTARVREKHWIREYIQKGSILTNSDEHKETPEGYITIVDAAQQLGCSDKTLRRAIESGALKAQTRQYNNQPILIAIEDLNMYSISRQQEVPHPLVETRMAELGKQIAELEQTVQSLQEAQLLGAGRDLLALGPSDDAYTQNRIDALEKRILALEARFAVIHERLVEVLAQRNRLDELERALQDTQDFLVVKSSQSHATPTYEDEWRITDINGLIAYHDTDEERTRGRIESLQLNYSQTKWTLHPPVQTSVPDPQPADETTFELADFSQLLQQEYRSSAIRGDVKAWLTLRPEPQGIEGDYRIDYFESGRADGKRGKLKGDQSTRGEHLKQDLQMAVLKALMQAGWEKGPHDIFVCPVDQDKS